MQTFMRLSFIVICSIYTFNVFAAESRPISSKIEDVTVFLNGAQITRKATVNLAPGTTSLLFTQIAANINAQSIQVRGEGNCMVLSVTHQLNYLKAQKKQAEQESLEEKKQSLQEQIGTENIMLEGV